FGQRGQHGLGQHVVDDGGARIDEQHDEHADHGERRLHEAAAQFDQVRDEGFLRLFLVQRVLLGVLGHGAVPVFCLVGGGGSAGAAGAGSPDGAGTAAGAGSAEGGGAAAGWAPDTACVASRAGAVRAVRRGFSVSRRDEVMLLAASSISLLNLRSSSSSISRWMSLLTSLT